MDASEIDAGLRELREQIMGAAQTWLASQVLTLQVSEQHGDDGALRSIQLDRAWLEGSEQKFRLKFDGFVRAMSAGQGDAALKEGVLRDFGEIVSAAFLIGAYAAEKRCARLTLGA